MFQNKGDTSKVMSVTMEKSKQQRFPLSDLLAIPVQRVMRYPLLVKDMEKCIRKSNMPSQTKLQQLQKLLTYLEVRYEIVVNVVSSFSSLSLSLSGCN